MLEYIKILINNIGGELVNTFSSNVTHIVAIPNENNCVKRTVKYIYGVLSGIWIVSYDWILESSSKGYWVDEISFEISGDTIALGSPKKGRLISRNQLDKLFKGYSFYFYGEFSTLKKEEFFHIIKIGGGIVLSELPKLPQKTNEIFNDKNFIICDISLLPNIENFSKEIYFFSGRYLIDFNWILDSISYYKILDIENYKIIPYNDIFNIWDIF
jgi:BRCA1-associated RING domain protein 1